MKALAWLPFRGGTAAQAALVVVAWGYLSALHWDNDGLWYQGDAPRHAANGLFWLEYLRAPSTDPRGFALSYYARYPVINLTVHPPVFHLLEAGLYGLFGPSPYAAKGLVLAFALLAGLYTTAWLRRWVGAGAGWGGALLLLLPGMARWSHAVMLNVPAFALGLAALYHARRWLEAPPEAPAHRHLYAAAAFCLLAVGTYFTAGVVVLVILAWLIALGRWRLLAGWRTLAIILVAALLLVLCVPVAVRWAPVHVGWATPTLQQFARPANWTYYLGVLDQLVSPHVLVLAAAGAAVGLAGRRWRGETCLLLIWLAVVYAFFSCLPAREDRYLLPIIAPVVCLGLIAMSAAAGAVGGFARAKPWAAPALTGAAVVVVLGVQAWLAARVPVPSADGYREVARFLEQVAPDEALFYDGVYDGVFTFHVQANDPDYRRRVVLGNKLLYAWAMVPGWRMQEYATTPGEVVEALRTRGGCRWLAVEVGPAAEQIAPARLLREAVKGPEFERVRSFPIAPGRGIERVDVYRLLGPVERVDEVELPFPILGEGVSYRVTPIPTRARGGAKASPGRTADRADLGLGVAGGAGFAMGAGKGRRYPEAARRRARVRRTGLVVFGVLIHQP